MAGSVYQNQFPVAVPSTSDYVTGVQGGKSTNYLVSDVRDQALRTEVQNARGTYSNLNSRINADETDIANNANSIIAVNTDNSRTTTAKDVTGAINELNLNKANLTTTPQKTASAFNYYIDGTNGLDSNNGLASGTAFKTIQHAFNSLPQIINHTINIYIANGSYNEDVLLGGFYGNGAINIIGDSIVSNSRTIKSLTVNNCCLPVLIQGLSTTTTTRNDINIANSNAIVIAYCNLVTTTSYIGVFASSATAYVNHNTISNKNIAIQSYVNSNVLVSANNGSNNSVALQAQYNGTIGKETNSITGTTQESTYAGGVIR